MNTFPVIKIQLQDMAYEIAHAFSQYHLDLSNEVERALKQAVDSFDFEGEVRKAAYQVLQESTKRAVESAIWDAFDKKGLRDALKKTVAKIIQEAL